MILKNIAKLPLVFIFSEMIVHENSAPCIVYAQASFYIYFVKSNIILFFIHLLTLVSIFLSFNDCAIYSITI